MMSSDDELDYMSEAFLVNTKNDIRPGLTHSYATKRKFEADKKKRIADENRRKKSKPIHEIQQEKLKQGLETPLDSSNKGFALMAKMGYKSGMSLGKDGTGISEPVPVAIKANRIGLGWKELLAEKKRKAEERNKRKSELDSKAYRAEMSNKYNQKKILGDLYKSQKICCDCDFKEGITEPHELWFWPEEPSENDEEDDDNDMEDKNCAELEPEEKLQIVTSYLRSTYLYCIWCCTCFEDFDDMQKSCPGETRSDHE